MWTISTAESLKNWLCRRYKYVRFEMLKSERAVLSEKDVFCKFVMKKMTCNPYLQ